MLEVGHKAVEQENDLRKLDLQAEAPTFSSRRYWEKGAALRPPRNVAAGRNGRWVGTGGKPEAAKNARDAKGKEVRAPEANEFLRALRVFCRSMSSGIVARAGRRFREF